MREDAYAYACVVAWLEMESEESWGAPPADLLEELPADAAEQARLMVRSLHLPLGAWSDAPVLCGLVERGGGSDDDLACLLAAALHRFPSSGRVDGSAVGPLKRAAEQLEAALSAKGADGVAATDVMGRPPQPGTALSLRREAAAGADHATHFKAQPSALAALEDTFRPVELAQASAPSGAAMGGSGRAAMAPAATMQRASVAKASASAAAASSSSSSSSVAATAAAGMAAATARATTGPLMGSRGACGWRSGGRALGASSGRGSAGVGAKRGRMMMIDADESSKLLAASAKALAPKAARGRAGAAAGGAKPREPPNPFANALVPAADGGGIVEYYQDRRRQWAYRTDATGGALLRGMFDVATPILRKLRAELHEGAVADGQSIYAQKPKHARPGLSNARLAAHGQMRPSRAQCPPSRAYQPPSRGLSRLAAWARTESPGPRTTTRTAACSSSTCALSRSSASRRAGRRWSAPITRAPSDTLWAVAAETGTAAAAEMETAAAAAAAWMRRAQGARRGARCRCVLPRWVEGPALNWSRSGRFASVTCLVRRCARARHARAPPHGCQRRTLAPSHRRTVACFVRFARVARFAASIVFAASTGVPPPTPPPPCRCARQLELISLDLATEWRPCAEGLGLRFAPWDVNDGDGVLRAAGWPKIDVAIISYVLYHYMSNEHCADWLARRVVAGDIGHVLIISREWRTAPPRAHTRQRHRARMHASATARAHTPAPPRAHARQRRRVRTRQ